MKILCPTDFSNHSKVAINYAVNLVNLLDAELHIVSAYYVPRKSGSFVSLRDIVRECSYFVFETPRTETINGYISGTTLDPINYTEQGEYEITWNFDYGNGTILQSKQKITLKDDFPNLEVVKLEQN